MRRVFHEPLVHFLLIGGLLFAGYAYLDRPAGGEASPSEIRLTLDDLAQLEILFKSKWERAPTPEELSALIEQLRANSLADPFMFRDYYGDGTPQEISREFGPEFAQAVLKLDPGSWQGPVESGYGWHLVFVDSVIPGRIPAFEEVETDVKTAWLGEQKAAAWQEAYDAMRAKYTVRLPIPPDGATLSATEPAPSSVETPGQSSGAPL